jgi:hypothetical protein
VTLPDGTVDRFIIKPLTITKLYQWLYLAKDQSEPAMVALVCDRDLAWVDSLDIDTFSKVANKCHEIVFPQAIRLAKGAPAAAALLAPVMQKTELGLRVIAILSTGYGEQSPKQPDLVSAPETPSGSPTPIPSTASVPSSPVANASLQPAT